MVQVEERCQSWRVIKWGELKECRRWESNPHEVALIGF
jgi:hypothetical protein